MYKKILVPLDGSSSAEAVLPIALSLANSNDAEIVLLRIAEYSYTLYAGCDDRFSLDPDFVKRVDDRKKTVCAELTNYLGQITTNFQQERVRVSAEVCEGPVVETILDLANRNCVDLIVLSTIGDGGGNPWMIGSIANRILRESKVPVFLIRPGQEIEPLNHLQYKPDRNSNKETLIRYSFSTWFSNGQVVHQADQPMSSTH